jgi:hypothetical protein
VSVFAGGLSNCVNVAFGYLDLALSLEDVGQINARRQSRVEVRRFK